jgi:hypothetical protein
MLETFWKTLLTHDLEHGILSVLYHLLWKTVPKSQIRIFRGIWKIPQLGLADFRVRSYAAVDRYMVVVHLAWAYVEQRFNRECSSQIQTYGDIIRRHRDEHAIDWLTGAVEMAIETEDVDLVLQHFLRLEAQPA